MLRHQRQKPNRAKLNAPWEYTPCDELILTYLTKYRYLRGTSLHQLIPQYHYKSVNSRLRILYDRRLIDKPGQQKQGYNTINDTDIYEILEKGEQRLVAEQPSATNLIRHSSFPTRNFEHAMMICDALSSIEIGATRAGVRFLCQGEILEKATYKGNPLDLPCTIRYQDYREETHVRPDGFFGLAYPEGGFRFFFLETEMGNHPVVPTKLDRNSVLKKLLAYKSVKERKSYEHLGIKGFTVLFLFPREGELKKPVEVVKELYGPSPLFMFNTIDIQKYLLKAPKPKPELYDGEWLRGGMEPGYLRKVVQSKLD